MLIYDLLLVLILAFLFALLIVPIFGYRNPRRVDEGAAGAADFLFFFILFVALIWAAGAWIGPVGPVFLGVAWLPFLVIGLVLMLLLFALLPRDDRRVERLPVDTAPEEVVEKETKAAIGISIFFVILILLLLALAPVAYMVADAAPDVAG